MAEVKPTTRLQQLIHRTDRVRQCYMPRVLHTRGCGEATLEL